MKNSFLVNIALLIFINVLVKPAYIFAVEIPVQNHVGFDAYGMFFTFLNLAYIFQLLSDFGLQNLTLAELPRDRSQASKILSNGLVLRLLLGIVFIATMSIAGFALGYWRLDGELFSIVMLNVLLISALQYVRANISGLGLYFKDSLISALDKLIMLVVLLIMLYGTSRAGFSIKTFALVQTLSIGLAIGAGVLILRGRIKWIKPEFSFMRQLLKRSIPYGILIALMFLYTRMDAIMIEKLLPDGLLQAGLYASAYRLYDAIAMVTFLFATLLLPMFTELENDRFARDKLYYGSLNLIMGLALIIAVPMILASNDIMTILYPEENSDGSIRSLALLVWAFVIKSSLFVTSTLLTSAKRLRRLIYLCAVGILINFVVNYVLIPSQGIAGASWATLTTQAFIAIGCIIICHSKGLVQLVFKHYTKIVIFAALMILALIYFQHNPIDGTPWFKLFILMLVAFSIFLAMNFNEVSQLSGRISRRKD